MWQTCDSCGIQALATLKCNSCSNQVCGNCMTRTDVWCFQCQVAFPAPPPTHSVVEPFRFDVHHGQTTHFHDTCEVECKRSDVPSLESYHYGLNLDDESCAAWSLKDPAGAKMHALMNMVSPTFTTKPSHSEASFGNLQSYVQEHSKRCLDNIKDHGTKKTTYEHVTSFDPCIDHIRDHGPQTLMICNLPCRTGYEELMDALRSKGFGDCVEFLHLPCRSGQPSSNLGYGFVSFANGDDAARFADEFEGYRFTKRGSKKVCAVKYANLQGFDGRYRHRMIHS